MQRGDGVQIATERLFAGLVAEQTPPGIGTGRTAKKGQHQQSRFRDSPAPGFGFPLVDAKTGKGAEIHGAESSDEVRRVEQHVGGFHGRHG